MRSLKQHIAGIIFITCISLGLSGIAWAEEETATNRPNPRNPWPALIQQAETLGLPTEFLKHIDPAFVTITFEDLRTYAAEYHPEDHRMILNMRLSFNEAGGALADLARMTHHDLALLYHELLHAYMDYLYADQQLTPLNAEDQQVLDFANSQMACHYRFVRINPIRQLKGATELRFLSDQDSWEVMNETWAVFVGWVLWTKLELFQGKLSDITWTDALIQEWTDRLEKAIQSGELLGYYEPDDPEERKVARKRFIAPSNGLTPQDVEHLLGHVLQEPDGMVETSKMIVEAYQTGLEPPPACQ
ncbi:MAG: hypothetical protein OEY57_14225 [Nitrospirota bacterium]|nr:hypothetical protein [Nitrospirota bacterium]